MKSKLLLALLSIVVTVFCISGLMKLRFETDILYVLPSDNKSVEALIDFRKHFSEDQQIVILLSSPDDNEVYEEDAASLAKYLREKMPDDKVSYRSDFEENPELFAKSIASVWSHSDPALVEKLTTSLKDETYVKNRITSVIDELSSSLDQQQAMISSYDPLGFLDHPALRQILQSDVRFASDTGQHRLLMIQKREATTHSYTEDAEWVKALHQHIDAWNKKEGLELSHSLTGGPVFNAEIGSGMEEDMSGTLGITGGLIILLFLWFQRSFRQLLLVGTVLTITFIMTLGMAGWLFGALNVVSVGFAAILIGLVIDYVVVILRENDKAIVVASAFRRKITPSILWAAVSTALMFGVLTLSSFEGVKQLAGIVAIGLLFGAFTALWLVPLFLEKFPRPTQRGLIPVLFPPLRIAVALLILTVASSTYLIWQQGAPEFDMQLEMLDEDESEATRGYNLLKKEFAAWSDKNSILISKSDSIQTLTQQLASSDKLLAQWKKEGAISSYLLPYQLVPNPEYRKDNQENLKSLYLSKETLSHTLKESGFSDKGVALTESILAHFQTTSLENNTPDPLTKLFYKQDSSQQHFFTGRLQADDLSKIKDPEKLSQLGTELTSWQALQSTLLPRVRHDFYWVFIPAGILLLVAMVCVFRSVRDTVIAVTVMLLSILVVNAVLVVRNDSWNSLSGMTIPLTIGAGIDYSIHLIYALRRHQGDFKVVWNSVGKAVCFCAVSTAIGFGSLIFASSSGLRSLGLYCSLGVLITMLLSLLLIPALWKWGRGTGTK